MVTLRSLAAAQRRSGMRNGGRLCRHRQPAPHHYPPQSLTEIADLAKVAEIAQVAEIAKVAEVADLP